jgi:hypothetical protein
MRHVFSILLFLSISCSDNKKKIVQDVDISIHGFFFGINNSKVYPNIKEYDFQDSVCYYLIKIKNNRSENVYIQCRKGGNLVNFEYIQKFKTVSDTLYKTKFSIGSNLNDNYRLINSNDSIFLISYVFIKKDESHFEVPFNFKTKSDSVFRKKILLDVRNLKELR